MLIKANDIDVSSDWLKTLCIKYGDEDIYNDILKDKKRMNNATLNRKKAAIHCSRF